MVRRRAKEGQSALADVFLAENRFLSVKTDLLSTINEYELQRIFLKKLCLCGNEDINLPHGKQPSQDLNLTELEEKSHEFSLNLQRIDQELLILKAQEKESVAAYSPQVSLRTEHTRGDLTGADNNVFLSVNFSLGAGSAQWNAIEAARLRTEAKYQERDVEVLTLTRTIQSLFQQLETAKQRQTLQQASFDSAFAVMQASERLYLSGRKSWQELMNSAREAYQAEALVVDTKVNIWQITQRILVASRPLDVYLGELNP
jgi:adhesin transport system outer membrane protein